MPWGGTAISIWIRSSRPRVLQVGAATIDRVLAAARLHIDGQRKRRKGIGSAIRRSIPVRTFADWRSTGIIRDRHGRTLRRRETRSDIASGWTERGGMP